MWGGWEGKLEWSFYGQPGKGAAVLKHRKSISDPNSVPWPGQPGQIIAGVFL